MGAEKIRPDPIGVGIGIGIGIDLTGQPFESPIVPRSSIPIPIPIPTRGFEAGIMALPGPGNPGPPIRQPNPSGPPETMNAATPIRLILEDGSVHEGRSFGAKRSARRRGGVQHRHDRLPGKPHRSLLPRPDPGVHLPAHRQLRRARRRHRRRPAGPLRVGGDPRGRPGHRRLLRRLQPLELRPQPGRLAHRAPRAGPLRHRHPRPDPAPARAGHHAGPARLRRRRSRLRRPRPAEPGGRGQHPGGPHVRAGPLPRGAGGLRRQGQHPPLPAGPRHHRPAGAVGL